MVVAAVVAFAAVDRVDQTAVEKAAVVEVVEAADQMAVDQTVVVGQTVAAVVVVEVAAVVVDQKVVARVDSGSGSNCRQVLLLLRLLEQLRVDSS